MPGGPSRYGATASPSVNVCARRREMASRSSNVRIRGVALCAHHDFRKYSRPKISAKARNPELDINIMHRRGSCVLGFAIQKCIVRMVNIPRVRDQRRGSTVVGVRHEWYRYRWLAM